MIRQMISWIGSKGESGDSFISIGRRVSRAHHVRKLRTTGGAADHLGLEALGFVDGREIPLAQGIDV